MEYGAPDEFDPEVEEMVREDKDDSRWDIPGGEFEFSGDGLFVHYDDEPNPYHGTYSEI